MPFQRWCGSPRLMAKARSLIARGPNTWVCRLKRFLALIGREQFTRMTLIATLRRGDCRSLAANRWSKRSGNRRADGEYRWFLSRALPVRNKRGEIVEWYGIAADI